MGKSTFTGPVQSENGYNHVEKSTSTGALLDHTTVGGRDARRTYLEEYFLQRPALNAVATAPLTNADASHADNDALILARGVANRNFEVLGTNSTTALVTYSATRAGITLTTAGADEDQMIITPHLDTNQTAWSSYVWGSENSVEWDCTISTAAAIDNMKIWAGLKKTNDQLVATDTDQAYFKFQTDATNSEAFTDYTLLHFVYSTAGTDYISALPITVAASTIYHLKIKIDSARTATIFVNGIQYNITGTAASTGGTAVASVNPRETVTRSAALADDVTLIPYVGIEAGDASAAAMDLHYMGASRLIFE
jgi:hypothetical protein|tara:strand:- start:820 stop:1749 length:930 start_codon:yes stop_codon:yes gene_type:complete